VSGFRCSTGGGLAQPRATEQPVNSKKTNKRRTSNIERPTSNIVFCHFIKRLSKPSSPNRLPRSRACLRLENSRFVCFKINKAQRHQHWMFDVGRSMFDVHSFQCSEQTEFHTRLRHADWLSRNLTPETRQTDHAFLQVTVNQ
jgi:hypothetical protein